MFDSCLSRLYGEMLPLCFGLWPKQQHVLGNLCIFKTKFLLNSPVENQLAPVNLIFLYISPLKFLNLVLIPGAKLDGHRGTWTGYIHDISLKTYFLINQPFPTDQIQNKKTVNLISFKKCNMCTTSSELNVMLHFSIFLLFYIM